MQKGNVSLKRKSHITTPDSAPVPQSHFFSPVEGLGPPPGDAAKSLKALMWTLKASYMELLSTLNLVDLTERIALKEKQNSG